MLPDFLVIGNIRSGTTWLDNNLREHPEIFLPRGVKGTHFFSNRYEKGINWYESHFKRIPDNKKAIGEVSPLYLSSELAAKRIKKNLPNVKIISIIRDPMESVWSHYLRELRQGRTKHEFDKAIKENPDLINFHLHYINLKRYFDLFNKNRIMVMLFDDIKENNKLLIKNVFDFIGVDSMFVPKNLDKRINAAKTIRFPFIAKFLNDFRWWLRSNRLYWVVNIVKKVHLLELFFAKGQPKNINFKKEYKIIIKDIFEEDVKKLSKLINRDLTKWLNVD